MKEREFLEPSFDTLCVAREGVVEMAMMMMMVTLCLYVIVHIIQRCMRMSCLSTLMHLIGSAWVKMEEIRNNKEASTTRMFLDLSSRETRLGCLQE